MIARERLERRALQVCVALAACVPVGAGLLGVLWGARFLSGEAALLPAGDGHIRYLSGLLLGIGLGFWSCIPGIRRKSGRFRTLGALVVLGGLARLYGFILAPEPALETLIPLGMELIVTPALVLWRERVGGRTRIFG